MHITPHLGHLRLSEVTPRHLNDLYGRLEREGSPGGGGPLSLTSVRHVHALLSGMYSKAVKEGLMGGLPPTKRASPPTEKQAKERRAPMRVWTAADLQEFLRGTRDDHYFPLWRLLAMTGMRRGEALGLHWSEVHLDEGYLALRYGRRAGDDRAGGEGRRRRAARADRQPHHPRVRGAVRRSSGSYDTSAKTNA